MALCAAHLGQRIQYCENGEINKGTIICLNSINVVYVHWDNGSKSRMSVVQLDEEIIFNNSSEKDKEVAEKQSSFDPVSAPAHYLDGRKFTATDCIRDWDLNFFTGNTVKYISRAGRKPGSSRLQDMEKALWYLQAEVDWLKSQEQVTKSDAPVAGTYSGQEHSIQRSEAIAGIVTDRKLPRTES